MPSSLSWRTRFADLGRLGRPERRGRLVHDQDPGVEVDRPGDRHGLALAAGQRLHRRLEVLEVRVEPAHDLARRGLHRRVVERAEAGRQLAAEEQVAGRVDVVGEGQRLVDRLDAVGLGVARVRDRDRLAVDEDLARSRPGARPTGRASASTCRRRCRRRGRRPRRRAGRCVTSSTAWTPPNATLMSRISTSGALGRRPSPEPSRVVIGPCPRRTIRCRGRPRRRARSRRRCPGPASRRRRRTMPGAQRLHDDGAEDGARDRADAAGERRPADHRRGDDVELVLDAEAR